MTQSAENDVTHWRRRALFAEEANRRAMRLCQKAVREDRTLQPAAVRDALAPQVIAATSATLSDESGVPTYADGIKDAAELAAHYDTGADAAKALRVTARIASEVSVIPPVASEREAGK